MAGSTPAIGSNQHNAKMRIVLLQLNYLVGNILPNFELIKRHILQHQDADLIITSELAATGYPLQDKLLHTSFTLALTDGLLNFAKEIKDLPPVLLGTPFPLANQKENYGNACLFLHHGKIEKVLYKTLLPNYNVFNEARYFHVPTQDAPIINLQGKRIGVTICEDIWYTYNPTLYHTDPLAKLTNQNLDLLVNIAASPFHYQHHETRIKQIKEASERLQCPVAYVNQVAGNTELLFDGRSLVYDTKGTIHEAACFAEDALAFDLAKPIKQKQPNYTQNELYWKALVFGTQDYLRKNGFTKAVLGLSGGIDSALCAAIVTHALGANNVQALLLPSVYSSQSSIDDALALAKILQIKTQTIPINAIFTSFQSSLAMQKSLTEENLQARIRGTLLMSFAAETNSLLVTTSNKSELAIGYSTLYGDSCGALSLIGDIWKTEVFSLVQWLKDENIVAIPENIQTKPPSAELRPDQKDTDSLPPYAVLDPILYALIEEKATVRSLIQQGYDADIVKEIVRKIEIAEFKRFQAAPILRVAKQALGTSWQMPLASASTWHI